ncbi:hypothetical protein TNCV_5124991 [Trichonephila clavipes]|nr:hypothetical protein TNCV_5124991 [Trichonephila clavipes]
MRARAYCAHRNVHQRWVLRGMSRCPDQVVSLKRNPPVFMPPSKLGTHVESTLPSPGIEPGPVVWKRDTIYRRILYIYHLDFTTKQ